MNERGINFEKVIERKDGKGQERAKGDIVKKAAEATELFLEKGKKTAEKNPKKRKIIDALKRKALRARALLVATIAAIAFSGEHNITEDVIDNGEQDDRAVLLMTEEEIDEENREFLEERRSPVHDGMSDQWDIVRTVYLSRDDQFLEGGSVDDPPANISRFAENTDLVVQSNSMAELLNPNFFEEWHEVVECVIENFSPFNINIVDERPQDDERYHMVACGWIFERKSESSEGYTNLFFPDNVVGLSFVDNFETPSIALVREESTVRMNVEQMCTYITHEIGHIAGLSHSSDPEDFMSYGYFTSNGEQIFGTAHEFINDWRTCGVNGIESCNFMDSTYTQNTFNHLMRVYGPSEEYIEELEN